MSELSHNFSEVSLKGVDLSSQNLLEAKFENSSFENCNFSGAILTSATIEDCRFENCDFSNVTLRSARLYEVIFVRSKLIGINWTQCETLRGTEFDGCNMNFCSFMNLRLKKLKLVGCRAHEVDFRQTDLSEANLRGTDLTGAQFNQTILLKADLRGASNYVIDPISNKIKGAYFELPEVLGLLEGLGIKIDSNK